MSGALARAQRLVPPGSRVWLFSDGWCTDEAASTALSRIARHADPRVVIVVDALERELVPAGSYRFEAGSKKCAVDLSRAAARAQFREQLGQGWRRLARVCDGAGVPWIVLSTNDEPDVSLGPLRRRRPGRP